MKNLAILACSCLMIFITSIAQANKSENSHHHHHSQLDVSNLVNKPKVELVVTADAVSGWNIQTKTTNFRFAPENVNSKRVSGEGHAHLYVDGKKIARLYSEWFHIGKLSSGKHVVKVSLNANDHSTLALNGEEISSTVEIVQE